MASCATPVRFDPKQSVLTAIEFCALAAEDRSSAVAFGRSKGIIEMRAHDNRTEFGMVGLPAPWLTLVDAPLFDGANRGCEFHLTGIGEVDEAELSSLARRLGYEYRTGVMIRTDDRVQAIGYIQNDQTSLPCPGGEVNVEVEERDRQSYLRVCGRKDFGFLLAIWPSAQTPGH